MKIITSNLTKSRKSPCFDCEYPLTLKRNVDLQHDIGVRRSYWMMVSPVVKNNLKCDADFRLEVNRMYDTMDLIVPILIIAAIAVIILAFFKSMKEINDNKKAPLLSVPAKVSGKRTDIIKRNQPNAGDLSGAHGYTVVMNTTYYVSFEIEDGERKEFIVDHSIYNTLLEETKGTLSFKGTKFISFE